MRKQITINPNVGQYMLLETRFADLRAYMLDRWPLYSKLTIEQKQQWRDNDPLLDSVLSFVERLSGQGYDS